MCQYCWCLCLFSDNVLILLVSVPVFRQRVSIVGVYACFQTMCQYCWCLCLFSDNVLILLVSVPVFRQRVNIVGVYACFQTMCQYCWCLCLFSDNVSVLLVSMLVFRQCVNIVGVYAGFQTTCQYCWCLCRFSDNVSVHSNESRNTVSPNFQLEIDLLLSHFPEADREEEANQVGLGQLSSCRCGKSGPGAAVQL